MKMNRVLRILIKEELQEITFKNKENEKNLLKLLKKEKHFYRFLEYMMRAREKHQQFYLTPNDFKLLETQSCHFCGEAATGFNKINPSLGYFKSNLKECCSNCNFMKGFTSESNFIKHAMIISEFQRQKELKNT